MNQRRQLEESGQWRENVDRTDLVLASRKPELQKEVGGKMLKPRTSRALNAGKKSENPSEINGRREPGFQ